MAHLHELPLPGADRADTEAATKRREWESKRLDRLLVDHLSRVGAKSSSSEVLLSHWHHRTLHHTFLCFPQLVLQSSLRRLLVSPKVYISNHMRTVESDDLASSTERTAATAYVAHPPRSRAPLTFESEQRQQTRLNRR